jgi:transposase
MFVAPLEGWRRVDITEQRTRKDWVEQIKKLVDEDFPLAEKIILVMDNLNAPSAASLYETYPAEEAKWLRDKLEIHYPPKHGSLLNMAEIELKVITTTDYRGGYRTENRLILNKRDFDKEKKVRELRE